MSIQNVASQMASVDREIHSIENQIHSIDITISRKQVILVIVGSIISVPLVIYFAQQWLQGFAFRMELSPMIFVLTILIALVITLLTVSIQTVKAAMSNPVEALRSE